MYEFAARRQFQYYLYQFIIPLTFIVCMSWAPFWISIDQFSSRQGVVVTSMLTIFAYRFILERRLPEHSCLTRFDLFMLGCTTLVFVALIEVVIVHRLNQRDCKPLGDRIDRWSRAAFPIVFVLLLVSAFWL